MKMITKIKYNSLVEITKTCGRWFVYYAGAYVGESEDITKAFQIADNICRCVFVESEDILPDDDRW